MKRRVGVTQQRLKTLFHYDEGTGAFTRLISLNRAYPAGGRAGAIRKDGYREIFVDQTVYLEHRLVWLYVYGAWPNEDIDHINQNKADNRLANLREASRAQNNGNTGLQKNNTTGFRGVSYNRASGKYQARIRRGGRLKHLGFFPTKEEAAAAAHDARQEYFGDFAPRR